MKLFSPGASRKEHSDLSIEVPRADNPAEPTDFLTYKLSDNKFLLF